MLCPHDELVRVTGVFVVMQKRGDEGAKDVMAFQTLVPVSI